MDRRRVVVCLRAVDPMPYVDPLTGDVIAESRAASLPAADASALETGLRIAGAWGVGLLAVSAGGASAASGLDVARSLGLETTLVPWPSAHEGGEQGDPAIELAEDEHVLARCLAAAIAQGGPPALVLCGDRSPDRGTGALPAFLADELGAAQACGLIDLEPDGDALRAVRRLDAGRRELLSIPLPAVCSVEAGAVRLRRASLPTLLATGGGATAETIALPPTTRLVRVGSPRSFSPPAHPKAPPSGPPRARLAQLAGVALTRQPPTVVGPVDAAEAADILLDYLARAGYLEGTDLSRDQGGRRPDSAA